MLTGSGRWSAAAVYLRDAVKNALTVVPGRITLVPGEPAWDQCDCNGQLTVGLVRTYYSEEFPAVADTVVGARCDAPYEVAEFSIVLIRCAPGPPLDGTMPTVADLTASAGLQMQDAAQILPAVAVLVCQLKDADTISDYLVGQVESQGPEGNCVGIELRVYIELTRS